MKYGTALLALATTALGYEIEERGRKGGATTLTTYTTVTTCPVTSTYTKEGSTYCVTELTTSTIVVTECHGCDAQVTTVYEPDVTKTDYETDYETITSLCPVTETKTVNGEVITVTYTTTEYIKKNGYTTIYETVKKPDETKKVYETDYETITSLCPVTETKTIDGHVTTITYTTTEYIKKNGYTTIYETVKKPDETKKVYETDYETITSLCPVTETKTIDGKVTTITYTTTEYIRKNDYTTIYETVKKPDETKKVYETDFQTITSLCPVTETKTINGEIVTQVYTSTQIIKENAYTTIYETVKKPDETKTAVEVEKSTITSLCPVTETKTVNGEVITKVYTSTQYIVKEIPTTIEAIETIYNTVHGTEVETHYSKVYVTVGGGTVVYTKQAPPNTIVVPQTSVVEVPPVTVTEVEQPPETTVVEVPVNAAQANQAPIVALMAGVFGAIALF